MNEEIKISKYAIFCDYFYSRKIYTAVICHKDPKKEFVRLKKLQEKLKKAGITNFAVTNNKIDTNYIIDNVIQCVVTVDKA